MNRRKFLKQGSLAGLSIPVFVSGKKSAKPVNKSLGEAEEIDLTEITIDELQKQMHAGSITSVMITKWYLKQIIDIDKNGPALNSVIEVNPEALSIAASMDAERSTGKLRGLLHGIPVLIKDNIDTHDKMMTTAGSLALTGNIASKDAFIVKQLRAAGAVLLGKTNLSEFANFRSTHSTSGWSSRGGQTKCPYILDRNPSGSSAGSGTAVAANLCAVAIGTETDGSIVSPASVNGLVGIKPTVGLWSRAGIIPISATQDTAGPMARTVKDAAILLGALAGVDAEDPVTKKSQGKIKEYTAFLDSGSLKGKRLGLEKSFLKGNPDVVALLNKTLVTLKENGAIIIEVNLLKQLSEAIAAEFTVLQYEFKEGLNKYLFTASAKVKSLAEVIKFNTQHAAETMPFFKQETLITSDKEDGLDSREYKGALAKSISARATIDTILSQNNLDALCGTTNGLACCIDLINGDYDTGFSFSSPAAMAGYPHITVPMGVIHGLPIGFSFFGTAYREAQLLKMAFAFEKLIAGRKAPQFLKTAGF